VSVATVLAVAFTMATLAGGRPSAARAASAPSLRAVKCYRSVAARAPRGEPPFPAFVPRHGELAVDRLGSTLLDLNRSAALCSPADVNGSDPLAITDPVNFEAYAAMPTKTSPPQDKLPQTVLAVQSQLGMLDLKLEPVSRMLVPAAAAVGAAGATPLEDDTSASFKCYRASLAKDAGAHGNAFAQFAVELVDPFGDPHTYQVVRPTRLCNPALPADIDDSAESLACFALRNLKLDPPQTKFAGFLLSTDDAFGPEVIRAASVGELCVPAIVAAVPTPTPEPSGTPAQTPTTTPSATPSPVSTPTPTATEAATPTPAETPTPTPAETPAATPTPSPSPAATPTPTATQTPTATPTAAATPTSTPRATPSATPTSRPSPSPTPIPSTPPCGTTLLADTTLGADVTGCSGFGLRIAAGITLDCAGHAIVGSNGTYGVLVDSTDHAEVRNCHVHGFGRGLRIFAGQKNSLIGNEVFANQAAGIELAGETVDNLIQGNLVRDNLDEGIHVGEGANRNTVQSNQILRSVNENLYFISSRDCVALDNVIADSGTAGIFVKHSQNHVIESNTVSGGPIQVRGDSSANDFENNALTGFGFKFEAYDDPDLGCTFPQSNHVTGGSILGADVCFSFAGAIGNTADGVHADTCIAEEETTSCGQASTRNVVNLIRDAVRFLQLGFDWGPALRPTT